MEDAMSLTRRTMLGTAAATGATLPLIGRARAAETIKIGVLNDMSGPYRDTGGPTSLAMVKLAAAEFAAKGFTVEVISGDHQNKPDVGVSIARQWYDRDGVDMIIGVPTSSVALAVGTVSREKNKAYINIGAGTTELTGKQCSPTLIQWDYDTYMLARSTGGATVKSGGTSWYFISADYAFGQQLQKDTTRFVNEAGGKVLGSIAYPFPGTTDFSSFLLQAQASGAKVLGLCNAGDDTVNCIKQAKEFGVQMQLAGMLMLINSVHALGLKVAQGLLLTESFYWDMNDRTRAFTKRALTVSDGVYPNMIHAGNYSGTLHFLKAVTAMGVANAKKSGTAIIEQMKKMPTDDDALGHGKIRADGRGMFNAYLFEVKKPSESKGPWDYYTLKATTPPDQAFRSLKEGACSFVKT
jgi:branched-chain amino acid transport system substrate-binding protein